MQPADGSKATVVESNSIVLDYVEKSARRDESGLGTQPVLTESV